MVLTQENHAFDSEEKKSSHFFDNSPTMKAQTSDEMIKASSSYEPLTLSSLGDLL